MRVDGAIFDVIADLLSGRVLKVVVDGVRSENKMEVSRGSSNKCAGSLAVFTVH